MCELRDFDRMREHLMDQINDLDVEETFSDVEEFFEYVNNNDRNDFERTFRSKGKFHTSVIANNNTGIDSMEFAMGREGRFQ